MVTFQISYSGATEALPNYMSFVEHDFGDGNSILKELIWNLTESSNYTFQLKHVYNTFGSLNSVIKLFNNVSKLLLNISVELDQPIQGFAVEIVNSR